MSPFHRLSGVGIIAVMLLVMGLPTKTLAQSKGPLPPSPEVPLFYSAQYLEAGIPMPPQPFNPFPELTVRSLGGGEYVYDDREVDYDLLREEAELEAELMGLSLPGGTGSPIILSHGPNDLWLEITQVTGGQVFLTLHNTASSSKYQWMSATDAAFPNWQYGPAVEGSTIGSDTVLPPAEQGNQPHMFFAAHAGAQQVRILAFEEAIEPMLGVPGSNGRFTIERVDRYDLAPVTVHYSVGGAAQSGTDYRDGITHDALSGVVELPQGAVSVDLIIEPLQDGVLEFDESLTVRLLPGHGFLIDPNYSQATLFIKDRPAPDPEAMFETVATDVPGPVGLDYNPAISSLIVSVNKEYGGLPNNFLRLYAHNGITVTDPWSTLSGLSDEIKLATAKGNEGGFTLGDVIFGNGVAGQLGWAAASGSPAVSHWVTLPGEPNHLRGSLHVDRTGLWDYDLMVVTGNEGAEEYEGDKGVWRVDASGSPTLVTKIHTYHLEGAVTLPNDRLPNGQLRWGPWAGKLLTGDEWNHQIFAIDPAGAVETFDLGIQPEDFDIILEDQDLYCSAYDYSEIIKLSRSHLTGFVDCLLITQAGEVAPALAKLYCVRWDPVSRSIQTWRLPFESLMLEHVTFAPINLPPLPAQ